MDKNSLPLISVVIPIYNEKKYLKKCLNSVVNQTYKNIEIILVDDGSTDGSEKICDKFAQKYENIKVIHQENQGGVLSRYNGTKESGGEYICFCDADDLFMPDTVKILYESIDDADFSVGTYLRITTKGRVVKRKPWLKENFTYNKEDIYQKLLPDYFNPYASLPLSFCIKLFRTDKMLKAFEDNKSNIRFWWDDIVTTLHYLLESTKVNAITNPVYKYRMNGYSSKYSPLKYNDIVELCRYRKKIIKDYNLPEKYNSSVEKIFIYSIYETLVLLWRTNKKLEEKKAILVSVLNREDVSNMFSNIDITNYSSTYSLLLKNKKYDELAEHLTSVTKMNFIKKIILNIINKILY